MTTSAKIQSDRNRTNLLRKYEQGLICFFVERIPSWINSDMLTAIGLIGSLFITLGLAFAAHSNRDFLLISILGFVINWFGDSLDGRLAYFRGTPRKWYGFSLDITADWLTIILIGYGYILYLSEEWKLLGFCFVVLYGWSTIIDLLRYKVTSMHRIDSGIFGYTEVRIILSFFLLLEIFWPGTIYYTLTFMCVALFIVDLIEFIGLLKSANKKDQEEK